ncbi:iporin-like isoform X1 [Arapaima gigas]
MMDSPPKLSGETIIVHHVPLVHCQIQGRQCCGPVKHPNPFCPPDNLGLTRTTSLPERDLLPQEALVYSSLIQTSSSSGSSTVSEGHHAGGGRDSLGCDFFSTLSCDSEEPTQPPASAKSRNKSSPLRRNPFLPKTGDDEEEDDEDDEGNNLNGYLEDSSFHLHGSFKTTNNKVSNMSAFSLDKLGYTSKPFMLHDSLGQVWCTKGGCLSMTEGQQGHEFRAIQHSQLHDQEPHGNNGSPLSMDWEEEEEEEEDHRMSSGVRSKPCSCCSSPEAPLPSSGRCCCSLSGNQLGYGSDSSGNSSDGVLVSFSAIYSKASNGVPAKPLNLNNSSRRSCSSSSSEPGGAFYLDLQTSPTEPLGNSSSQDKNENVPYCRRSPSVMDANCNSYALQHEDLPSSEVPDLSSCIQSQARQNYYKLVTCDLSSQSSPSPAGSSTTSCSEDHNAVSLDQPTEYFLFRRPQEEAEMEEDEKEVEEEESSRREEEENGVKKGEQRGCRSPVNMLEGQVYVNITPAMGSRSRGGVDAAERPRSRSYDRNLDVCPSLERMLSCPMRLSEGGPHSPGTRLALPPPRVTSFAEIARSRRRGTVVLAGTEASYARSQSSLELEPQPLTQCNSQGSCDTPPWPQPRPSTSQSCEARIKAEGGLSSPSEGLSSVVRYSKEQRPNSLPIQPFMFQHQLSKTQNQFLRPLLSEYINQMQGRTRGQPASQGCEEAAEGSTKSPATLPDSVRPSPLGSYSPVHQQDLPSSGTCSTCSPSPGRGRSGPQAPRSLSCPTTAATLPLWPSSWSSLQPNQVQGLSLRQEPAPPSPGSLPLKEEQTLAPLITAPTDCVNRNSLPTVTSGVLSPLDHLELIHGYGSSKRFDASDAADYTGKRPPKMYHLSPQALKWREYRRRNPLGLEDSSSLPNSLSVKRGEGRLPRRNVFNFPASSGPVWQNGQGPKSVQHHNSELPDYFSLAEKPPEEFCLSPDATSESVSIDLLQKKDLVKAINMAVDLIVAHFGTSRDPGVKAKLGNSSVSPNVGHLVLKYLCPAIRNVLQDGLRSYVLDLIIGQRRNQPWSIVEASTQLGPSTRVLHGLFSKVSQYSELTSHSMRLNAFIFGLLNLRTLEFWFNHLFTHEDIVSAHYHPWGFLPLSQGACRPLFEELLLLLQPLSLLPFDLDLLFEPRLLQKGQEHIRRKEQLCSAGLRLEQSARSTFQLMRGFSKAGTETKREAAEAREGEVGLKQDRIKQCQGDVLLENEVLKHQRDGLEPTKGKSVEKQKETMDKELKMAGPDVRLSTESGGEERGAGGIEVQMVKSADVGWDGEGKSNTKNSGEAQNVEGSWEKDNRRSEEVGPKQKDRQAGWWYQLMQSSQVYIDNSNEGSKFVKWEKRKKPAGRAPGNGAEEAEARYRWSQPPPREGVVEGAEASQLADTLKEAGGEVCSKGGDCKGTGRPLLMGSHSEPRQTELKELETQSAATGPPEEGPSQAMWWGRLFGAGTGNTVKTVKEESGFSKSSKIRLPSGWLSLDKSVLGLMAQTVGTGRRPDALPAFQTRALPTVQEAQAVVSKQQTSWSVRALCHHIATEPGHLSFNKGDVLQVLGRAEPDWLQCTLGGCTGMVPIIYVTLTEDLHGPH